MAPPRTIKGRDPIISILDKDRRGVLQLNDQVTVRDRRNNSQTTTTVRAFLSDRFANFGTPAERLELITTCSTRPFAVADSLRKYVDRLNSQRPADDSRTASGPRKDGLSSLIEGIRQHCRPMTPSELRAQGMLVGVSCSFGGGEPSPLPQEPSGPSRKD